MKLRLTIIFSLLAFGLHAQDKIVGDYYNYFGSTLKISPDSTFEYRWQLDQSSSWTKGIWKTKNDTVFLKMVPVYDTIQLAPNKIKLVLSINERGERVTTEDKLMRPGATEGQDQFPIPPKLFFQGTRLYGVEKDGSLKKAKVQGYRTERKFDPWFMRVEGK